MTTQTPRIGLAVDDSAMTVKVMSRTLGKSFDQFHIATSPAEAEAILQAHPVTHLVCDFGAPWRTLDTGNLKEFPTLGSGRAKKGAVNVTETGTVACKSRTALTVHDDASASEMGYHRCYGEDRAGDCPFT